MQVPIFKIFVSWHSKKVPKVPFFGLEGTLITTDIKKKLKEKHPKAAELKQSVLVNYARSCCRFL